MKLPDINTSIHELRNRILRAIKRKNPNTCYKSLNQINNYLPDNYQINIPKPPQKRKFKNRDRFDIKFAHWIWFTLIKLERKMEQFRNDCWERGN